MNETKKTLEELLLNLPAGRYGLVGMARQWISVLRNSEDGNTLTEPELIRKSIYDIVSGDVKDKQIKEGLERVKPILMEKEARARESERKYDKGRK